MTMSTLVSGLPPQAFKKNRQFRPGWEFGQRSARKLQRLWEKARGVKWAPDRGEPGGRPARLPKPLGHLKAAHDAFVQLADAALERGADGIEALRNQLEGATDDGMQRSQEQLRLLTQSNQELHARYIQIAQERKDVERGLKETLAEAHRRNEDTARALDEARAEIERVKKACAAHTPEAKKS
jgi:hypothetical protein